MTELTVRILVAVAVVAVAVLVGLMQRRARAVIRHRRDFHDMAPGMYVFTSSTCSSCDELRSQLSELRVGVVELTHEHHQEVFAANRVDRVPALARVGEQGQGWIAFGRPSTTRLLRWTSSP